MSQQSEYRPCLTFEPITFCSNIPFEGPVCMGSSRPSHDTKSAIKIMFYNNNNTEIASK